MGEGWFYTIKLSDPGELDGLMDKDAYDEYVAWARLMRYLPLTDADRRRMLDAIGVGGVDDLFRDVPEAARRDEPVDLPHHAGGNGGRPHARHDGGAHNLTVETAPSFLGAGIYHHFVPAAVDHLIQRGEFLTSYTPYQPEVAQGTLQYLFEFQTQVAMLTGMEVANASMYDGATASAEAAVMAARITRRKKYILSGGLHPHYRSVTETLAGYLGHRAESLAPDWAGDRRPGKQDRFRDRLRRGTKPRLLRPGGATIPPWPRPATRRAPCWWWPWPRSSSLGAIVPPGDMGADIVAGEGQSLGNALNFGGPTVGLLATRDRLVPPDARPSGRRNRRRRRSARLCADAVHSRAAYPPRKGDQQHLHPIRACARWPSPST